jgi:hypothetical protein
MNRRSFIAALCAPFVAKVRGLWPNRDLITLDLVDACTRDALNRMDAQWAMQLYQNGHADGGVYIQVPIIYGDNRRWS